MNFDIGFLCYFLLMIPVTYGQFMKGSSPAQPSNVLDICQRQAVASRYNVNRQGQHADVVNLWCSTYRSVVPCIERTLPTANNPNDWFLSLVFNKSRAYDLSMSMCRRFPTLSNLTCVEKHLREVAECMKWTTTSAIRHFNELHNPLAQPTPETRLKAFIYACVISDTTAKCFHRKLTTCSPAQRDLLYDYYIMLSGHCKQIMDRPKTPTLAETRDDAKVAERKPNWDLRPSPLDTPSHPVSQSTARTGTQQQAGATETTGGPKTWRDKLYPKKTNWENSQSARNVPVRTGNYRNTANGNLQFNSLMILLGGLFAMTNMFCRS